MKSFLIDASVIAAFQAGFYVPVLALDLDAKWAYLIAWFGGAWLHVYFRSVGRRRALSGAG